MTIPVRRRLVGLAAAAILASGLAACGGSDARVADVQKELEAGRFSGEQASCVTAALFDDLDQGQINDLYQAGSDERLPREVEDAFASAVEGCPAAG